MGKPEDEIEEDIGGVQGSAPEEAADQLAQSLNDEEGAKVTPTGGGEIEWAGGLIRKAPEPSPD